MSGCDISNVGGDHHSEANLIRGRMELPNTIWQKEVNGEIRSYSLGDKVLYRDKVYRVFRFVLLPKKGNWEEYDDFVDIQNLKCHTLKMVPFEDLTKYEDPEEEPEA